jgi:predicted ATP-grasp superfamily ATP-dependent carboligase
VTTVEEAQAAVAELTDLGGMTLVQQLLTGRREAVSLLRAKGEIHARFAQWEKRTNPPLGGEGVLRQSIAVPDDIGAQAERLVNEIGLDGYSQVEFRRDTRGVPYLMEINPRLSASIELAVRCGVDFPYLHYQWASGQAVDRVEHYRVGAWLRYVAGDLESTLEVIRQHGKGGAEPASRALLSFGLAFLRPTGYDGIDWRDPVPTARSAAHDARYFAGRLVGKARSLFGRRSSS